MKRFIVGTVIDFDLRVTDFGSLFLQVTIKETDDAPEVFYIAEGYRAIENVFKDTGVKSLKELTGKRVSFEKIGV